MVPAVRPRGFSLVEMMVALSLGLLVLALALQGALTMQNSLYAIERRLRLHQDGQFALLQLADSWRKHGRFACAQLGSSPGAGFDTSEGMRFRYGVRPAVVTRREGGAVIRWSGSADLAEAALASCASLRIVRRGDGAWQWRRESGDQLLILPGSAEESWPDADPASLEAMAIKWQRYFLRQNGNDSMLWLEQGLPGQATEAPQLLAAGVTALRQRFGVRSACRPLTLKWREQAGQLSTEDWRRLLRVELTLEMRLGQERWAWSTMVALTPALPCALEPGE
ncbi:prepilin-type N-terminal cleavage/methylation domain-containing protein [Chromobacterium sp.]|uniref:prepilin-type N-terminal cleavage/methylation domain-containing protein n=1 Tax=Chromobacterium sp. TaxID=306190 RepID=UPI0035AEE119